LVTATSWLTLFSTLVLLSLLGLNSDLWPGEFEFLEIWPSMNKSGVSVADYRLKELARIEDIICSLEV
jgi:hypothetical protein